MCTCKKQHKGVPECDKEFNNITKYMDIALHLILYPAVIKFTFCTFALSDWRLEKRCIATGIALA